MVPELHLSRATRGIHDTRSFLSPPGDIIEAACLVLAAGSCITYMIASHSGSVHFFVSQCRMLVGVVMWLDVCTVLPLVMVVLFVLASLDRFPLNGILFRASRLIEP